MKGHILSCISHANIVILTIVISQVFPCHPVEDWVLGYVSYILQLLSVLFWVFWIQLKMWKYVYIQNLHQFYQMGVSVYWRMSHSVYHIGSWFNLQDGYLCASACDQYLCHVICFSNNTSANSIVHDLYCQYDL